MSRSASRLEDFRLLPFFVLVSMIAGIAIGMFFIVLLFSAWLRFPYADAVAVAFNATGRDFEIAIVIAITAFSPTVALATVVGPLIEVPVMLFLVWSARRLSPPLFRTRVGDSPTAAGARA